MHTSPEPTPDLPSGRRRVRRPPATAGLSARPTRARVAKEIVATIRGDIATGRLPLGTRLPAERDLAQHYAVSQPTVREAVRALEVMGLVDVRHGSGVYVTNNIETYVSGSLHALMQIERVGILEVLDLRESLGSFSATRAAELATDEEVERMRRTLASTGSPPPDATPNDVLRPAVIFQLAVSFAARNPLLFAIEGFLIKLIIELQIGARPEADAAYWLDRVGHFAPDRDRLLEAIAARDPGGATAAMAGYMRSQREFFSREETLVHPHQSDLSQVTALAEALGLPDFRLER